MTPHIESKLEDIAEVVIMPGDPERAEYIAQAYLQDVKKVNGIRNMSAYTGYFKGKRITVFASGMGISSIGIYAYELFQFYHVQKIIRIGSSGSMREDVRVRDVVLASSATSCSNFAKQFSGEERKTFPASERLNTEIRETARENGIEIKEGDILTSDVFDVYVEEEKFLKNFPEKDYCAVEMEAYALFYLADLCHREAACLLTIVDSKYEKDNVVSPEDREKSLDKMIELALLTFAK